MVNAVTIRFAQAIVDARRISKYPSKSLIRSQAMLVSPTDHLSAQGAVAHAMSADCNPVAK